LLVQKMDEEGFKPYPLHLGVTEAGDGEDGRIKSSVGIGTLLEDGLGDTIRVSLTEEPEAEVPVAFALARRYEQRANHAPIPAIDQYPITPFEYNKRKTRNVLNIGGDHHVPRVMADFSYKDKITPASLFSVGYNYSVPLDKWNIADMACDYIFAGERKVDFEIPGTLGIVYHYKTWLEERTKPRTYPYLSVPEFLDGRELSSELNFIYATIQQIDHVLVRKLTADKTAVLVLDTKNLHGMAEQRRVFAELITANSPVPVIIARSYAALNADDFQLYAATDLGGLLVDGLGDGVFLSSPELSDKLVNQTSFNILQATRTRISKTEYISCPSCGRTLFDLQETTAKIRSRTSHLKGVKIGIMGCIVNGPGEMADADYGYVGSGPGRITLYKGKEVVRRNVPTAQAVDELVGLIREHGDWIEPPTPNS
jgi:(E)-4-hydroxy-3-methylbut-2-enyl-diphosphate synthase